MVQKLLTQRPMPQSQTISPKECSSNSWPQKGRRWPQLHICPRNSRSCAVLGAADKGNYLAAAKGENLRPIPHENIQARCPNAKFSNPASFLPRGKTGKTASATNFKKKLEDRAETACYLRKIGTDLYEVWMPTSNKITTVRIADFILQSEDTQNTFETCNDDEDPDKASDSTKRKTPMHETAEAKDILETQRKKGVSFEDDKVPHTSATNTKTKSTSSK